MSGLPSTSGTTSSVAFIRRGKLYIGHVGDSKIVLGYQEPGASTWLPLSLTKDHKPDSIKEKKRIYSVGGLVMCKAGVERVVWNRPRIGHKGPVRRSTHFDQIPFLAVARSLGDLWSYNYSKGEFVVSPEPDVSVYALDPRRDRCIVLASDGLWNVVATRSAVVMVQDAEEENEQMILEAGSTGGKPSNNPSKILVDKALNMWYELRMRADNTSVVTVLLDPPGPPKSEVLLRQKIMQKLRPRDEQTDGIESPSTQAEVNGLENKGFSKPNSESECSKISDSQESPALKDKKVLAAFEAKTSNLPKPVVLSPRRIHVKRSPGKPQNSPHVPSNQQSQQQNCDSSDNAPTVERTASTLPVAVGESSSPNQQPAMEQQMSTPATCDRIPNARCEITKKTPPCVNQISQEDKDSCKNVISDNQKECSRTHLSEVENIVKNDNLEDRLLERSKSVPRAQENKGKIGEDNHMKVSPTAHKRKHHSEGDTSVAAKTLKLGNSWMRDSLTNCGVTVAREHNTRSQQRPRKVKVR